MDDYINGARPPKRGILFQRTKLIWKKMNVTRKTRNPARKHVFFA